MTNLIQTQMLKEQMLSKHSTNHILHLILCIPTAGLWFFIWPLIAFSNSRKRAAVEKKFELMELEALKNDQAN